MCSRRQFWSLSTIAISFLLSMPGWFYTVSYRFVCIGSVSGVCASTAVTPSCQGSVLCVVFHNTVVEDNNYNAAFERGHLSFF